MHAASASTGHNRPRDPVPRKPACTCIPCLLHCQHGSDWLPLNPAKHAWSSASASTLTHARTPHHWPYVAAFEYGPHLCLPVPCLQGAPMPAEAAKRAPSQFELKQAYEAELLVSGWVAGKNGCLFACLPGPPARPAACLPGATVALQSAVCRAWLPHRCPPCLPCLTCLPAQSACALRRCRPT